MSKPDLYYIPQPSKWPFIGAIGLFLILFGIANIINEVAIGPYLLVAGFVIFVFIIFRWFGEIINENLSGVYNKGVDSSFRWGMSWFIFSEVMFFATFFGSLFFVRVYVLPDLELDQNYLWEGFQGIWPSAGPAFVDKFTPMTAWGIPTLNTFLLLSSGVTITIAHWGLIKQRHKQLIYGLIATIALGLIFIALQAYEYSHAYTDLNLTLATGIYGSLFYMLTGFHGLHVTLGLIMLTVILVRSFKHHFKPEKHFAFEGVAWYWHFVDVVWILLFFVVYLL